MPLSKCNSIAAKVMGLIFALIDIASSWNVQLQHLHQDSTKPYVCSPVINSFLQCCFTVCVLWIQCKTWASASVCSRAVIRWSGGWGDSPKISLELWVTAFDWHITKPHLCKLMEVMILCLKNDTLFHKKIYVQLGCQFSNRMFL